MLIVLVAGLVVAQPRPGTVLVLLSGKSDQQVGRAEVSIHSGSGWKNLGQAAPGRVPGAPATRTAVTAAAAPGSYDAVRLGPDVVVVALKVDSNVVEPVLLTISEGRAAGGGAYAGNDEVNLGLGELGGKLSQLPPFRLVDQDGRELTNSDLAGHEVIIAAFHTTCREVCPIYTGLFLQLRRRLPASTMLFEATTDPEHDTPQALKDYGRLVGAKWTLATGAPAAVEQFWSSFQVGLAPGDAHVSTLAIVDRHGYVRIVYRGVPHVDSLPATLSSQLSAQGQAELRQGGEGWGSPQVVDALHTIGGLAGQEAGAPGPAPAFSLPTLDGGTVTLAAYRGRPLVVNFWASWCPACAGEMPMVASVTARHPGVQLLLIDYRDDDPAARTFLKRIGVKATSAADRDGAVGDRYHVRGLPVTVFVRKDGSIEGTYTGELDEGVLGAHIADLEGR